MIKDVEILYSLVNMKLRDSYASLDEYCEDADIDRDELETSLNQAGYFYNAETNQFR